MCGDDDGGGGDPRDLHQMFPDGLSQQRVHPHCWLIQYEKLRLLEQGNSQAGSPGESKYLLICYKLAS